MRKFFVDVKAALVQFSYGLACVRVLAITMGQIEKATLDCKKC